jgi:cytoskeletal protein CcmA (bactofilin family)
MNDLDFKKLNFSVLGKNCNIEGDLKFAGDTLITCDFNGTITMTDNGKLILERGSKVIGTVYCNDIEVFGDLEGTVKAAGTMIVRSSAKVSGNIEANRLSVYPGALLNIEGHTPEEH